MPYQENQTATNPTTGQKYIFKGGGWAEMPKAAPEAAPGSLASLKGASTPVEPASDGDAPMSAGGYAKAAGSGILHDAIPGLFGLGGDIPDLASKLGEWGGDKLRQLAGKEPLSPEDAKKQLEPRLKIPGLPKAVSLPDVLPGSEAIHKAITDHIAPDYVPQNTSERAVKTIAGFSPGALMAPEGAGIRTLLSGGMRGIPGNAAQAGREAATALTRFAVAPGLASEAAGSALEGTDYELPGRVAAGMLAPGAASKIITPNKTRGVNPAAVAEHQRMVNELRDDFHINTMTPAQIANNPGSLAREAKAANTAGSGTATDFINQINERNVTRAALQHGGVNNEVATPQTMQQMRQGIDNEFGRLTAAHSVPFQITGTRNRTANEIRQHLRTYQNNSLTPSARPAQVVQQMEDTANQTGGFLNGRQYQNFRSQLGTMSSAAKEDPSLRRALAAIRNSLDDAMERTIQRVNPNDVGAFRQARELHRNSLILEHAVDPLKQTISPDRLMNAVRSVEGTRDALQARNPLARLATSAHGVLKPLEKASAQGNLMEHLGLAAVLGGTVAGGSHAEGSSPLVSGVGGAGGAAIGAALPSLMAAGRFSRPGRALLSNQLIRRTPLSQNRAQQLLAAKLLSEGNKSESSK